MRTTLLLAACLPALTAADRCIPVDASRVLIRDVVAGVPALSGLPPDLVLGYSPAPGLSRWWKATQLQAIAARHGVSLAPLGGWEDFCVERPAAPVSERELTRTLGALLPAGAMLELVDYSRLPLPHGELRFALGGLTRPHAPTPRSVLLWRGRIVFDGNRSVPFWASVRIDVPREGYYAARPIAQGAALEHGDLRMESRQESIFSIAPESDSARLIGRVSRRSIPEGAALTESLFDAPREVHAGEAVVVEVQSGAARLRLDALAINGGRSGERVLLRNQASGKQFRAKVQGKSRAVLDLEDSHDHSRPPGLGARSTVDDPAAAGGQGPRRSAQAGQGNDKRPRPPDPGS